MENKKILIVCRIFPPTPGIGGRRWVKFAKYLHRKGYDIAVVSEKIKYQTLSNWTKDIEEFKEKIEFIDSNHIYDLTKVPKNIIEKIFYKMSINYIKLSDRGNYFDSSLMWKKKLLDKVEDKINQGYTTIIASGAPFRVLHHLIDLRKKHKEIQLIGDLRDPWESVYSFHLLSEKRKKYELEIQKEVVENFDKIISVYENMSHDFKKRYNFQKHKFYTLDNGFDKEDFQNIKKKSDYSKTRFLFAGTFYNKAINVFENFLTGLDRLKEKNKDFYYNLMFDFYGNIPLKIKEMADRHNKIIKFNGLIPMYSVYEEIANSEYLMLFLMDEMNFSLSTKFYEYILQNKPVVLFANEGEAGKFIENKQIGYFANGNNVFETFCKIEDDIKHQVVINPKDKIDTREYDVEFLTNKLIGIIEK
jgi:glycosyltransferase involved in cell wall biosynthesis